MSYSAFVKNRQYNRCRIACSTPPVYWFAGIHRSTSSRRNGPPSYPGEQYRKKYQLESTNVSIVSVSRVASRAADRARDVLPGRVARQRRLPARLEVDVLGQQHRQLVVGHGHLAVHGAVHDRDRRTPVPLP